MCFLKDVLSIRSATVFLVLAFIFISFAGCVAPFSDLQSARILGPGNFEVTPGYSSVSFTDEGETQHLQDHFGIQAGFGILDFLDLRARYERISADIDEETYGLNVIGFGPKLRLIEDWLAFYVPIGFAFGEDIDVSETWQVHPTLLATWPLSKSFEIIPSAKVMIPFSEDLRTLYAFNLGMAIGTDVRKWAVRPEVGICTRFDDTGYCLQFSIGFTLSSGLFRK